MCDLGGVCVGIVLVGIWSLWGFRYSFLWVLGALWYLDASGCVSWFPLLRVVSVWLAGRCHSLWVGII